MKGLFLLLSRKGMLGKIILEIIILSSIIIGKAIWEVCICLAENDLLTGLKN